MAERSTKRLPSLRLLAALRDGFLLPLPSDLADRRRLQRYLSGKDRPSESAIADLVRQTVTDLFKGVGVDLPPEHVEGVTGVLLTLLVLVDYRVFEGEDLGLKAVQQIVVSVGFHVAGYYLLTQSPPPAPLPPWIAGERDAFLERLLLRGRDRNALFASLDTRRHPSRREIEALLAGGCPRSDETLAKVARLAASGGEFARTYQRLRCHYAMRFLRDAFVQRWGIDATCAIADQICRVAWYVHAIVSRMHLNGDLGDEAKSRRTFLALMVGGASAMSPSAQAIPWFAFRSIAGGLADEQMASLLVERVNAIFFPSLRSSWDRGADALDHEIGPNAGTVDLRLAGRLHELIASGRRREGHAVTTDGVSSNADPRAAEHHVDMARSHVERRDYVAAARVLREAPPSVREDIWVRLFLARVLLLDGACDQAVAVLEDARPEAKDYAEFHMLLAWALARTGHPQKARTAATKAAALGRSWFRSLLESAPDLIPGAREP